MALDVRVNSVNTRVGVVDGEALLSPEVLETIVRAVRAALAEVAVAPANPFEFVVFRIAKALDALSVVE